MITADIDISGFNKGIARFVDKLGLNARVVVKKEAGELVKTLVKITPPADPKKTKESIAKGVLSKFDMAATVADSETVSSTGETGDVRTFHGQKMAIPANRAGSSVEWYGVTRNALYGVAQQMDMRKASVEDLRRMFYMLTPKGRQKFSFTRFHNRSQKVIISQNLVAKESQLKKLVLKIQSHIGRLKAGWLTPWDTLQVTGGNKPPSWVMRHKQGARGRYVDGLGVKNHPTFSISNSAVGIGHRKVVYLVQSALNIRVKAMAANFRLMLQGKKKISDYA